MLSASDQLVLEWASGVVQTPVTLEPPSREDLQLRVSVYLTTIETSPHRSLAPAVVEGADGLRRGVEPHRLMARYVVSVAGPQSQEGHEILGTLCASAMEQELLQARLDPRPPEFWLAVGVTPRPSFDLVVPATLPRQGPRVGIVREFRLDAGVLTSINGRVLGPQEAPIPGAVVEWPALNRTTRTDANGHFRFSGVPAAAGEIRVRAKGCERRVRLDGGSDAESGRASLRDELIVRIDPLVNPERVNPEPRHEPAP